MTNSKGNEENLDEKSENQNEKISSSHVQHAEAEETSFGSAQAHPKQVMLTDIELKNMQKELMDYKDKYLRLLADGDNARKRMQKERQEMTRYAVENILVDFLRPLDNLENALKFAQNMSDEVKNWAFGFQMILSQFKDILTENGVQPIDSLGLQFDPHCHEAVETIEIFDKPTGTILEEYVRGYKMGERTIRPARVKVAKMTEKELRSQDSNDQKEELENL